MRLTATLLLVLCAGLLAGEDLAALKARLATELDANQVIDPKVRDFAKKSLLALVSDPALVAEAKAQNAVKTSLDEIKRIDAEWTAAEKELPIQKEKLSNKCAEAIRVHVKTLPALLEVFAMDNQGANVGQLGLTSDYWQGDEDKWKKSFADGKGGIDVGKAKLDKSAGVVLQQVSLPLADADGAVVGAITLGIAPDRL